MNPQRRRRFVVARMPADGHLAPALPIARELVRRGDHVEFWAPRRYASTVAATGAALHAVDYPRGDPASPALAYRFVRAPRAVRERAAALPRDTVVVHDPMLLWGRRLGLRSAVLGTTTMENATTVGASLAGALARRLPGDAERWAAGVARVDAGRRIVGLPLLRQILRTDPLTLVPVPAAFQPHADSFGPTTAFVGPGLAEPEPHPFTERLDPNRPLLYVSLGAVVNRRPEVYRACLDAFAGTQWQLVVSTGFRVTPREIGAVPGNAVVVASAPQRAVLQRAAAFLSHGGMNSVMESLHTGVPLVLLPHTPEQAANADRVVAAGAGVRLDRRPSPARVRAAVEHVHADPAVAAGVHRTRAVVRGAGGVALAASILRAHADDAARHA